MLLMNKFESIFEEAITVHFKTSWNLPGGTEESHKTTSVRIAGVPGSIRTEYPEYKSEKLQLKSVYSFLQSDFQS
jgi:hypothetical protein